MGIYKHKCNTNTDWPLVNISEYLWTPMNIRPFQLGVLYKYEHSHSTNTYGCKCGWKPPLQILAMSWLLNTNASVNICEYHGVSVSSRRLQLGALYMDNKSCSERYKYLQTSMKQQWIFWKDLKYLFISVLNSWYKFLKVSMKNTNVEKVWSLQVLGKGLGIRQEVPLIFIIRLYLQLMAPIQLKRLQCRQIADRFRQCLHRWHPSHECIYEYLQSLKPLASPPSSLHEWMDIDRYLQIPL